MVGSYLKHKKKFTNYAVSGLVFAASFFSSAAFAQAGKGVDPLAFKEESVQNYPTIPVTAYHGMVVSASNLAASVGANILKSGGNAVDAAVAVAYAMAVTYPAAGNIGGGGFMVLRLPTGQSYFVDFREKAPQAAMPNMYLDKFGKVIPNASVLGWKAVAVPGTVAGMEMVRQRWGTKSRAVLMSPAIQLAKKGYILSKENIALMATSSADLARDPYASRIFLQANGNAWKVGDRFRQPDLARTLSLISQQGAGAFYKGAIAKQIVAASSQGGGILTLTDFERYRPRVMQPLQCSYRGYQIDTAPPPSGGGVALCEMLNVLSGYNLKAEGLHTPDSIQRQVEAMRHAYSDRRDLGDPAFVNNPINHLVDPSYAEAIRRHLSFVSAVGSDALIPGQASLLTFEKKTIQQSVVHEKAETTHFSIIDQAGMSVSVTYTLNGWYGARVVAGKTGIVMNDEMDDFSTAPGKANMYGLIDSKANQIAPGKTPLSSMSPTIISKNGQPFMIIGSPGGSRIPTIILSVVTGVIDYGLNIQQAINLPRFHQQWKPEDIQLEAHALDQSTRQALQKKGYGLDDYSTWGIAEGIMVGKNQDGQRIYYGGVDYRHAGGAAIGE